MTVLPFDRYALATRLREAERLSQRERARLRRQAVADAHRIGMGAGDIAAILGVSRARADQLVKDGKELEPVFI